MIDKNNDGGPAFPDHPLEHPNYWHQGNPGMSLRDWFAGKALAVVTAAADYTKGPCDAAIAERAYAIADAMLKARELQ